MKFPIQLPDQARTLIIHGQDGEYRGQSTYWKRNGRWEMIGVTKPMNWLHQVAFRDVKRELKARGLVSKWVKAHPFTTKSFAKEGVHFGWI